MTKSKLLVAAIWIYIVGTSAVQGWTLPMSPLARQVPFPWPVLVGLPLVVLAAGLFDNSLPGKILIGERVDKKFGADTYRQFLESLKPELLLFSMCVALGGIGAVRNLQVGGPVDGYKLASFFASGAVAFLVLFVVRQRRGIYEPVRTTAAESIAPTVDATIPVMDEASFWSEARKRRNLVIALFPGWLLAGFPLFWIFSHLLPTKEPMLPGYAALATWGGLIFWAHTRLIRLRCFKCGGQAFGGGVGFVSISKCRNCGATPFQDK